MTPAERQRTLLLEQQERILGRLGELERQLDALTGARRGEFDDDEHDPDGASLSSQWSMLAGLVESAREEARMADSALQRLDTGQYGMCTACGRPIPDEQLAARPLRERCVACAS